MTGEAPAVAAEVADDGCSRGGDDVLLIGASSAAQGECGLRERTGRLQR
jgi:hypothetical protein